MTETTNGIKVTTFKPSTNKACYITAALLGGAGLILGGVQIYKKVRKKEDVFEVVTEVVEDTVETVQDLTED